MKNVQCRPICSPVSQEKCNEIVDLSLPLHGQPLPATCPPESRGLRRDEVKLLVVDRTTGHRAHQQFWQLPDFLRAGDVLVVNNSQTIPASLRCRRGDNEQLRIHVAMARTDAPSIVERRTDEGHPDATKFKPGETLEVLNQNGTHMVGTIRVIKCFHPRSRFWCVEARSDLTVLCLRHGRPIQYDYVTNHQPLDAYQTLFARHPGSAEMPSAARPFTPRLLRELGKKGVLVRSLTLHTGVSSHEVETDLAHHPVLPEWYSIPEATAAAVRRARHLGRRVIAVGTTVVRALESAADDRMVIISRSGWTSHLVTPEQPPRVATSLLTGLHTTQTSHLALLYGFLSRDFLLPAYQEAIDRDYLWHEFGDSNLIL